MKITILDAHTANPGDLSWDELEKYGELAVYPRTKPEEVLDRIANSDIVYTNKTIITKEVMEKCKNLKYIGVLATGYNVVDCSYAKEKGIIVTNVPGYSTNTVAQFAFSLLLELCLHVGDHSNSVKKGDWENSVDFAYWNYPLYELHGKTLGIVGFGEIGEKVYKIAEGFGMKVIIYSRTIKNTAPKECFLSLDEFLKSADIISIHCPLTPETENLINKASIAKMKDGVLIVNTSRGPIINEPDLAEALDSGKVGGAAVDVVSKEPILSTNPLLKSKNTIITPHIAWAAKEARVRLLNITFENLKSYINGNPINVVNK